ncbi:MAG: hypothetical protein R6U32_01835 [Candidatus Woesearchaeota archaeon]
MFLKGQLVMTAGNTGNRKADVKKNGKKHDKRDDKKENKKDAALSFLKNRYAAYAILVAGAITADAGVLLINSQNKGPSIMLIVIGALAVFFALYLIASDRLRIPGYRIPRQ